MRYKNNETGAIVDSPFKLYGKNWESLGGHEAQVEEKAEDETPEESEAEEGYVEEEVNLEEMTKTQLISFAKEQEIEVDEKDKKADIIETIVKAFEE